MLTTLAIFNSNSHAKAILHFDKTGIQIVGENKIGKTTLINSLNFLYIIDKEKMSFDSRGGKTTYSFKQSLDHFFPSHKQSFIIFECLKTKVGGYFCILVKRKAGDEDVEYYKIDKHFEESDYLHSNGNMKNFEEVQKFFALENLIKKINDRKDLFPYVYSQDSKQNVFLWITDTVKRKGQSLENSFTKVYRFLLNASSVDNDSLKEALMIADEKSTRALDVFVRKDKFEKIEKFKKEVLYLNKLKQIQNEFEELKLLVNKTGLKQHEFEKLLSYFHECLNEEIKNLQDEIKQYELEISNQKERKKSLESKKDELSQNMGKLQGKLESFEQNKSSFEKELKEIEKIIIETNPLYNTAESLLEFLESRNIELQKEYNEILSDLQSVERYNFTQKEIEQKINQLKKKEKDLQTQIEKDGDLFIQHISEDKQIRETLNSIFSEEILSQLTKDDILEKVLSLNEILSINEGKIKIEKIHPKPLASIEELKEKLEQTQKELKQQNDILETIRNQTKKEEQSKKLNQEIYVINEKIKEISKKEEFEKELASIQNKIKDTTIQLKNTKQEKEAIVQEIKKLEKDTEEKEQKKQNKEREFQKYESWVSEFQEDFKNLFHKQEELENELSLTEQYQKLKELKKEWGEVNRKKEEKLRKLQEVTGNFSAEPSFIAQIEEEVLSIENKEKSIETLLEQISNELIQPVQNFLGDYKQFETFLGNFNRRIAKYKISDLSSLKIELQPNTKLYNDLEKISKIIRVDAKESLFVQMSSEQLEYLKVLEEYVTSRNKEIFFEELFDITLNAYDQNGNHKKIDLKKGNESQGTIRLINLILFLLVICYFKVSDEENKLVFFIDEDVMDSSNTEELLRFCKENGFIVIFAAKHIIPGLEKYYFLKKSSEHLNKVFLDERHAYLAEKK